MSTHTLEQVLFDLASNTHCAADYLQDRQAFLAAYPLQADEARLMIEMDVREMVARNVNPMLAMRGFSAVEGRERIPEYLRRLRCQAE
jgi:hypothetical protein